MSDTDGWIASEATVFSCGWQTSYDIVVNAPEGHCLIVFSYKVDGKTLSGEFTSDVEMKEGQTFQIEYDPQSPEKFRLNRVRTISLITWLTPLLGIAIALAFWLFKRFLDQPIR